MNRFREDQRGAAAIEFAIIAPMMILLYCGFAQASLGMMATRRAGHAASIVADLVAQGPSIAKSDMTDIFNVGDAIVQPFPVTPLQIVVSSVTADANVSPVVSWSLANRATARKPKAKVTAFPPGLLAATGDSMIMAEVTYSYALPLPNFLPNTASLKQTFYLKPRRSASVTCSDCPTS
jgi:Flp pilus assembly protein TadG